MRVLLTGASGFVGHAVQSRLLDKGQDVLRSAYRIPPAQMPEGLDACFAPQLSAGGNWRAALEKIEVVIHSAALVHVMVDQAADPLFEFRKVNVEGTLNLARQAIDARVKRFIFISSIKVNGESTILGKPYTADDMPTPVDSYGISKMEAERGLHALGAESGMEVVIIRPVLVYGLGVKANFRNMMRWLNKGLPLPLGAIANKRSLVALDNLVDLIVTCIEHPMAANNTFLVSDGEDLSTTQLLHRMGQALGKPARLLPVPTFFLKTGAALIGKRSIAQRLCGSLQVDIGKTRELLGWIPPVAVDEALRKTARHFLEE